MSKILSKILIGCTIFVAASCTNDFEEFNSNPYEANKDQMQYDAYSTRAAIIALQGYVVPADVNLNQFVECLLGGSFGGYLADANAGFVGKNFATYNPEQHWIQVPFNDIIPNVYANYTQLQTLTEDPVILSVADVIKVAALHRVTDMYGHIPYSKIGQNGELQAPYDKQADVYKAMFDELDKAIEVFTNNQALNFNADADNVFDGNVLKWAKFANSLKLRLAMRVVYADEALAKKKAEEVAAHPIGTMSSIDDNAFNIVANNPFRVIMYDYNDGDSRVSADITSYMNGYNDPRCSKYFTETTFSGAYIPAFPNGYYGLRTGINIGSSKKAHMYSNMNVAKEEKKLMWMNAAESAFLKAEGALRGWNMNGTAEEFYNQGIQLSFEQWGAEGSSAYLNDETSTPDNYVDPLGENNNTGVPGTVTIKYNTGDNFETNLERIITQKWIANFPLGHEAWSDFRRTGYPKLMAAPHNLSNGVIPVGGFANRLPYPQREYQENAENLNAILSKLGGPDNMATRVWWDCKTKN